MKVYLFYIEKELVPDLMLTCGYIDMQELEYNGTQYVLYASTPDKKKRDRFKSLRSKDFISATTHVNKKDYKKHFYNSDLYYKKMGKLTVLTTMSECYNIEENWLIILTDDNAIYGVDDIVHYLTYLTPYYKDALLCLGVTVLYSLVVDSELEDFYTLYNNATDSQITAMLKRDFYSDDPEDAFVLSLRPNLETLYLSYYAYLYKAGKEKT